MGQLLLRGVLRSGDQCGTRITSDTRTKCVIFESWMFLAEGGHIIVFARSRVKHQRYHAAAQADPLSNNEAENNNRGAACISRICTK